MRFITAILCAFTTVTAAPVQSVQGVVDLVQRRLPNHINDFAFYIVNSTFTPSANSTGLHNDTYTVSSTSNGKILVEGNSVSALSMGLHRYLTDLVHVDIYWFIGSQLHLAPSTLPKPTEPLSGSSVVPWRYHFNTVTFSYTAAFWSWEDWELQLDWMALRGVNLPLAWVGVEQILVETFQELGMTDAEISTFLSGPAFQAWNRFGNEQGSWGGDLPMSWIKGQSALQKKIVQRMVELGMTPVLPAFPGFVPRAITRVRPSALIANGSQWEGFPVEYTNDTFLEPSDPLFYQMQKSFIAKQAQAYGNITHVYTLDQFNENDPQSGDLNYLRNVSYNTWQSLKQADPAAIWMLQGWLFYSNEAFWTNDRVEAFLGGVEVNSDMLILDLFSESQPQWQRTNSYYGKPWLWCQLHDYGGNMGLYGQVENITVNSIEAMMNSTSLVGFGLTMEGQEGNEIVYDLLLDQAWSAEPIDTASYFYDWVTSRYSYSTPSQAPPSLYSAWDLMRTTVYNNTNLTAAPSVTKSIFVLSPNTTGLLNRTGHHPTTLTYNPSVLVQAWRMLYVASNADPSLWVNSAYQHDLTDVTRQVLANAFTPLYTQFISDYDSNLSVTTLTTAGNQLTNLLLALDSVLATNLHFSLSTWIASARAWANSTTDTQADFYEYSARNQITLWGPTGQINDYASKNWAGVVSSYYIPRWTIFVDYLTSAPNGSINQTTLAYRLLAFEEGWQTETWGVNVSEQYGTKGELKDVLKKVTAAWPSVFDE